MLKIVSKKFVQQLANEVQIFNNQYLQRKVYDFNKLKENQREEMLDFIQHNNHFVQELIIRKTLGNALTKCQVEVVDIWRKLK